ncbi:hypothetical protein GBAR_LOCUS31769, partial [Geodia barretti]
DNGIADSLSRSQFHRCRRRPHPHPCLQDRLLTRKLEHLQTLGIAPSTRRTYQAGVHHYQQFCRLYDLSPWPASELTLRYFCTHAYKTLSHATILVYLAAIRHHHLQLGHTDPLVQRPLLAYLCKGIKRHQGTKGRVRLPLSAAKLAELQQHLGHLHLPSVDKIAVWAALSLG